MKKQDSKEMAVILRVTAEKHNLPPKVIDSFVETEVEKYDEAVKITNEHFSTFNFRKLFI